MKALSFTLVCHLTRFSKEEQNKELSQWHGLALVRRAPLLHLHVLWTNKCWQSLPVRRTSLQSKDYIANCILRGRPCVHVWLSCVLTKFCFPLRTTVLVGSAGAQTKPSTMMRNMILVGPSASFERSFELAWCVAVVVRFHYFGVLSFILV